MRSTILNFYAVIWDKAQLIRRKCGEKCWQKDLKFKTILKCVRALYSPQKSNQISTYYIDMVTYLHDFENETVRVCVLARYTSVSAPSDEQTRSPVRALDNDDVVGTQLWVERTAPDGVSSDVGWTVMERHWVEDGCEDVERVDPRRTNPSKSRPQNLHLPPQRCLMPGAAVLWVPRSVHSTMEKVMTIATPLATKWHSNTDSKEYTCFFLFLTFLLGEGFFENTQPSSFKAFSLSNCPYFQCHYNANISSSVSEPKYH